MLQNAIVRGETQVLTSRGAEFQHFFKNTEKNEENTKILLIVIMCLLTNIMLKNEFLNKWIAAVFFSCCTPNKTEYLWPTNACLQVTRRKYTHTHTQ